MIDTNNYKIKKALISVSDKTGVIEFAKELTNLGIEIYSTGGTASLLHNEGINVHNISELTSFPEILDGRVKTLHPAVHAGLLAVLDNENHIKQLSEHNISSIDLLVVNLYPFEETVNKDSSHNEIIENIDIGGPSMLRSAAKNYLWTAPVVNPNKYQEILKILHENNNTIPGDCRLKLAAEVFSHTSYYDTIISNYFNKLNIAESPEIITIPLKLSQKLRYGENPHQSAMLYGNFHDIFTQLHGKELSYNNIVDIDAASKLIVEFDETALAFIKHTNPSGVAIGNSLSDAYQKAYATDTVSPYGGIVAVNRLINSETAKTIHSLFTEVIIAPAFSTDALEILTKKRDRRLIQIDFNKFKHYITIDWKSVAGGFLMQYSDTKLFNENGLNIVTKRKPTDEEMKAMMFGWKVAKHVKSNAVVYTTSDRTLGIGAGQMSRVDSSRIATEKARMMGLDLNGSAVSSDAYLPFPDALIEAVKVGATCIIQPGGSIHDQDVIKAADDNNIAMIFTGIRHFRH